MNKNQNWRRVLSLLFAMVMLVSIMVVGSVVASAAEDSVAEVNGVGYPTLQAAIEAAPVGSTVDLLKDVSLGKMSNNNSAVLISKSITLNGNGHTLTTTSTATRAISINADGDVTVKNLKIVTNAERGFNIYGNSAERTITIDNVQMSGSVYYAINTATFTGHTTLDIVNGSYIYGWAALNFWSPITVNVEASTLHGHNPHVGSQNSYATIVLIVKGSEINVDKDSSIIASQAEGAAKNTVFLLHNRGGNGDNYIVLNGNTTINIEEGAKIVKANPTDVVIYVNAAKAQVIDKDGVPVMYDTLDEAVKTLQPGDKIEGLNGTTDSAVSTALKEAGFILNADGTVAPVASVNGVVYSSLQAAIDAIADNYQRGYTITLLANCAEEVSVGEHDKNGSEQEVSFTLDLNGFDFDGTIQLHNKSFVIVDDEDKEHINVVPCDPNLTRVNYVEALHMWIATRHGLVVTEKAATCTTPANVTLTCNGCDFKDVFKIGEAAGHTPDEAVVENKVVGNCVTDTTYDLVVYCSVCDAELSRDAKTEKAEGHDYKATVTPPTFDAQGYTTYTCANNCGSSYVDESSYVPALVAVAKVGDERFETLQAAINYAANGATVTLLEDVTYNVNITLSGKEITLDLNGKVISLVQRELGKTNKVSFNVAGTLILVDSSDAKTGKIAQTGLEETGAVTLANGKLIVNSGYIYSNYKAIQLGGSKGSNTVEINGGKIEGNEGALNINKNVNYVSITNGQFVGGTAAIHVGSEAYNTLTIAISGGNFNGNLLDIPVEKFITGGTFTNIASKYLADGYCLNNTNGLYTVGAHNPVAGEVVAPTFDREGYTVYTCAHCGVSENRDTVAKLVPVAINETTGVRYQTLTEAISKASAGNTIRLLDDVDENVTVDKKLTIHGYKTDAETAKVNSEARYSYTGTMTIEGNVDVYVEYVNVVSGQIFKSSGNGLNANITIKYCSFDEQDYGDYAINLGGTNAIVIENCTAIGSNYAFLQVPNSNSSVSVKNVTLNGCMYGFKIDYSNGVTLTNVTITNTNTGIWDSNYGYKLYTITDCKLNANTPIFLKDRKTDVTDVFVFNGENEALYLGNQKFALYKLAAGATLVSYNRQLAIATDVADSCVQLDGNKYFVAAHVAGTEATCTENQTCTACGIVLADKLGHNAGAEATCTVDQTCTICGVVLVGKLGHSYDAVVTAPTFDAQGYTTHTCANCGDSYVDSYVPALIAVAQIGDVKYTSLANAIADLPINATATIEILMDYTETHFRTSGDFALAVWLGNNRNVTIDFNGYTVTFDADNYTQKGPYSLFYVSSAGTTLTLTGNGKVVFNSNKNVPMNVVWAQGGLINVDGCSFDIKGVDPGSDLFYVNQSGTIHVKGGFFESETKTYINKNNSQPGIVIVSGGSFKQDILATTQEGEVEFPEGYCISKVNENGFYTVQPHSYVAGTPVPPSAENGTDGYTTYTCAHCGDSYDDEIIKLLKFKSSNLLLTNTIGIYFNVDLSTLEEGKYYVVVISFGDDIVKRIEQANWIDGYKALFTGIAAKEMTDEFTATIVCTTDNTVVCQSVTESVKSYAQRGWNSFDDAAKALLAATLNYGAEAQNAFNYNPENLANDFDALKAYMAQKAENNTTEETKPLENKSEGVNYYGASLNLNSNIVFNFKFLADAFAEGANISAVVTYVNVKNETVTLTLENGLSIVSETAKNGTVNLYVVKVDNLLIQDAAAVLTCTISDDKGNSFTATDSVIYYSARAINGLNGMNQDSDAYKKQNFKQSFYYALVEYVQTVNGYAADFKTPEIEI